MSRAAPVATARSPFPQDRLASTERYPDASRWSSELKKRAGAVLALESGQQIYVVETYVEMVRLLTDRLYPRFWVELHVLSSIFDTASELFINEPAVVRLYSLSRIAFVRPVVDESGAK